MAVRTRPVVGAAEEGTRGVVLTKKNYLSVHEWVSRHQKIEKEVVAVVKVAKDGSETDERIKLFVKGSGWRVARVGDTVARTKDGYFYVIKAEQTVVS